MFRVSREAKVFKVLRVLQAKVFRVSREAKVFKDHKVFRDHKVYKV